MSSTIPPSVPSEEKYPRDEVVSDSDEDAISIAAQAGVKRIEALSSQFTLVDRIVLFFGIFLLAYVYGLDGQVRFTYQV